MTLRTTTAIVVSFRTGPRLRDCLYALKSDPEVSGIVIVDNGNPERDATWLRETVAEWDKTEAVLTPGNVGFGRGCNLGAAQAAGDVLLFINPDAMLRRGSVSALQGALEDKTGPCLVGGKIFGLDGKEQRGGRRRDLTWATALGLRRWTLEHTPAPTSPIPMPVVSGAFFAIPKSDFQSVGGFDEAYFLHVEDVDLCRTVRAKRGCVIYQPKAGALHFGATADAPDEKVARHKADSLSIYFRKWAANPLDQMLNTILLPLLRWHVRRSGD